MTENPNTNASGTYDLLNEQNRSGGVVPSTNSVSLTPAAKAAPGKYDLLAQQGRLDVSGQAIKIKSPRPLQDFTKVAPTPQNPAGYDQQGFMGQLLINLLLMITGAINPDDKGNNPLIGLLSKAFGFQSEDGVRDLNARLNADPEGRAAAASKVRGTLDYSRFDRRAASDAISYNNKYSAAPVNEGTYKKFLDHLNHREGYRRDVYRDSEGKLTVGVGHLVRPEDGLKLGDRISDSQVKAFLEKDGQKAFEAARRQATELGVKDESFIIALGSVNYQLGTGWREKFPETWNTMKRGDLSGAAAKLEGSLWNKQTPTRVDDFQAALRQAEGTKNTFAAAASGTPQPPATNNPIILAADALTAGSSTRRLPPPGSGLNGPA